MAPTFLMPRSSTESGSDKYLLPFVFTLCISLFIVLPLSFFTYKQFQLRKHWPALEQVAKDSRKKKRRQKEHKKQRGGMHPNIIPIAGPSIQPQASLAMQIQAQQGPSASQSQLPPFVKNMLAAYERELGMVRQDCAREAQQAHQTDTELQQANILIGDLERRMESAYNKIERLTSANGHLAERHQELGQMHQTYLTDYAALDDERNRLCDQLVMCKREIDDLNELVNTRRTQTAPPPQPSTEQPTPFSDPLFSPDFYRRSCTPSPALCGKAPDFPESPMARSVQSLGIPDHEISTPVELTPTPPYSPIFDIQGLAEASMNTTVFAHKSTQPLELYRFQESHAHAMNSSPLNSPVSPLSCPLPEDELEDLNEPYSPLAPLPPSCYPKDSLENHRTNKGRVVVDPPSLHPEWI